MIYHAAAALPHEDRIRALDGLRGQLRIMAVAAGTTPDWTTLTVAGPDEVAGAQARTRFEWHASVVVHGGTRSFRLPDLVPCPPADGDECLTAPLPAVCRTAGAPLPSQESHPPRSRGFRFTALLRSPLDRRTTSRHGCGGRTSRHGTEAATWA